MSPFWGEGAALPGNGRPACAPGSGRRARAGFWVAAGFLRLGVVVFASDRDLLVYEPRLFLETGWLGQLVFRASGLVTLGVGFVAGVDFAALGVSSGSVVSYGGASYEVARDRCGAAWVVSASGVGG